MRPCLITYLHQYGLPRSQLKHRWHDPEGRLLDKASGCNSLKEKQQIHNGVEGTVQPSAQIIYVSPLNIRFAIWRILRIIASPVNEETEAHSFSKHLLNLH